MPTQTQMNRTKRQLDSALRTLLRDKTVEQVRVQEVAELCGIRRQSFYYHFPDVRALLDWSVKREGQALPARQEKFLSWQQALTDLLGHTAENRLYYRAVLESLGRPGLRRLLDGAVEQLLERTADYYRRRCGAADPEEPQLKTWWKTILLTLLESWICGDLDHSPAEVVEMMDRMVRRDAAGAAWQSVLRWEQPC